MERQIRLMHIVKGLGIAGLENVVTSLILNMKEIYQMICIEERFKVNVTNLENKLRDQNVKIFYMNRPENQTQRKLPLQYRRLFKKESIDIIHTHSGVWRDAFLGGKLAGIPLHFHTEHGMPVNGDSLKERFTYRFLSRFSSQVIAVSEDLKSNLVAQFHVNPDKVTVIHNGIDLSIYKPASPNFDMRKKLGIPPDEKIIGTVGRIVPLKDHKTLVRSFALVCRQIPDCRLVIIGREDTNIPGVQKELVDVARELNVQDKIIFTGERNDVRDLLNLFDIFVLSSWTEGISISLLEAVASGKPVVATMVGGNSEIVKEGKSGFLVPPRHPEKLAERLLILLKNKKLAEVMGRYGREIVEKEFSLKTMATKYHRLYETFSESRSLYRGR